MRPTLLKRLRRLLGMRCVWLPMPLWTLLRWGGSMCWNVWTPRCRTWQRSMTCSNLQPLCYLVRDLNPKWRRDQNPSRSCLAAVTPETHLPHHGKNNRFFARATPLLSKEAVAIPSEEDLGARANQHQLESEAILRPTSYTGSSHRTQYLSAQKSCSKYNSQFVGHKGDITAVSQRI